jgi:ABC-type polysaccharide/polyol phosphate export permease
LPQQFAFFRILVARQVRQDYLENLTGFAWLVLQPLMMLAVYAFVFTTIFSARLPESLGIGFVPFLAVAFWPWTAFSESILKASNSISGNAALIGKVAFATELLPLSSVAATFLMHSAGYLVVLLVLQLAGTSIHWLLLPVALLVMAFMWLLASAIALFASAMQVFVRDVGQILPPLMTFWFFTTPIVYSAELFPERFDWVMEWNLMAWFVGQLRGLLLFGSPELSLSLAWVPVTVVLLFGLGLKFYRRLSGHFEDFI